MRDIVLTLFVFGALPFALVRPYIGILLWTWISLMNPQRLCWGFAFDFPYAYIIAIVTLVGLISSPEAKKVPWTRETVILALLIGWMFITTIFAVYPFLAWPEMERVAKIQFMVFVTMMVIRDRRRLHLLIWVMALSLAFYGIKGGIFTIAHGGVYHVMGPALSFIGGNNQMGLALIMTIPLLRYLQLATTKRWVRNAMTVSMLLCAISVIGSQSRGDLLGLVAMGLFLWLKSRNKFFSGLLIAITATMVVLVMPEAWYQRMETTIHYQHDASAEGRINAWKMAINMAEHKPLGGGFFAFQRGMFAIYAPKPWDVHASHSIYFQILGEQGFLGLFLFLALGFVVWRACSGVIKRARGDPESRWAGDLAAMLQVSLVGYGTAGAFLGLAHFDLYYDLIAVVVMCKTLLAAQQSQHKAEAVVRPVTPLAMLRPETDST